jgi:hypothetical protein
MHRQEKSGELERSKSEWWRFICQTKKTTSDPKKRRQINYRYKFKIIYSGAGVRLPADPTCSFSLISLP